MNEFKLKNTITGLKFSNIPSWLKSLALKYGLDCKLEIEKHIFTETVSFEIVSSDLNLLNQFKSEFETTVNNYNN